MLREILNYWDNSTLGKKNAFCYSPQNLFGTEVTYSTQVYSNQTVFSIVLSLQETLITLEVLQNKGKACWFSSALRQLQCTSANELLLDYVAIKPHCHTDSGSTPGKTNTTYKSFSHHFLHYSSPCIHLHT